MRLATASNRTSKTIVEAVYADYADSSETKSDPAKARLAGGRVPCPNPGCRRMARREVYLDALTGQWVEQITCDSRGRYRPTQSLGVKGTDASLNQAKHRLKCPPLKTILRERDG